MAAHAVSRPFALDRFPPSPGPAKYHVRIPQTRPACLRPAQQVAQVIPVELPATLKFLHQARGVESGLRLPELQHYEAADERLIERSDGEHAEIVDVARFVPLIAGANFLGKYLGEREAHDLGVPADYLGFFATAFAKSEKAIAILAAAEGGHLLFAQRPSAGKDMIALLKEVLEKVAGKGGGTLDFARGRLIEGVARRKGCFACKRTVAGKRAREVTTLRASPCVERRISRDAEILPLSIGRELQPPSARPPRSPDLRS